MLPDLVQSVFTFVNKPKLFKAHIQKGAFTHFPAEVVKGSTALYATPLENLQQGFEDKFCNLQQKRPQIAFLIIPFTAESDGLKAPLVEDEAVFLFKDDGLKCVLREGILEF